MLERLFGDAHEYANLANRNQPVAKDVLEACNDAGLTPAELRRTVARSSRKRKRSQCLSLISSSNRLLMITQTRCSKPASNPAATAPHRPLSSHLTTKALSRLSQPHFAPCPLSTLVYLPNIRISKHPCVPLHPPSFYLYISLEPGLNLTQHNR